MGPLRFFRALAQWLSLPLLLVVLAALLSSGGVFAQAVPATAPIPRVAFPLTHVGNVTTFGAKTADAANAANFSFGVAANGSVFATAPSEMPTAGGKSVLVNVGGSIPKASVAAALGRFAMKALPVLSAGVALYDLGQELGFGVDPVANVLRAQTAGSVVCSMGTPGGVPRPGYMWHPNTGTQVGQYCGECAPHYADASVCQVVTAQGSIVGVTPGGLGAPLTATDVEAMIAARSSWPESSALARATVDAINSGEALDVQPSTVTGPASVPGASSQVVDPIAGTTTNISTVNNYNYAGAKVTTNAVTTSVTTNNAGNVVSSSTTSQSPDLAELPKPLEFPCGGPGLPACSVKVDETATPATVTMADPFPQMQADQRQKLDQIKAADGSAWEPVKDLFFLPPSAQCIPFEMPSVMGVQVPSLNACPVVGGIQQVVGVLWYIAGFWIMLGWVREVV